MYNNIFLTNDIRLLVDRIGKIYCPIIIGSLLFCSILLIGVHPQSHITSVLAQASAGVQLNIDPDQEVVVAIIGSGFGTADIDATSYSLWENKSEIEGVAGVDDDNNGYVDDFHGWDWIDDDNVIDDLNGHGTQSGETLLQIVEQLGVDRHRVRIQPLRISDERNSGRIINLVEALDYAVGQGAPIVHFPVGIAVSTTELDSAIQAAYEAGVLIIAPAHPWCSDSGLGAEYHETLTVASTLWLESICSDTETDIIVDPDSIGIEPSELFSTNQVLPYVTAIAALIHLQNPKLSSDDIRSMIISTADNSGMAFPVLNIEAALGPDRHKLYLPLITK